ncbi:DUF885 domain-containing protein [Pseudomaricurvus alkylphenolicus]|uniref:DUF885 domain-containing protein n=1 Tax=Pseudomaricurvus alkylphenolicus TaxID=1306991 RepID=UPI00142264F1|nr:DUF885 domain-containing protein [Pseudomaricurvus alkylphenolicus]NIB45097.1 DUF885 domain-containing protein [Pseudomaricurvus alkylphenolicus]
MKIRTLKKMIATALVISSAPALAGNADNQLETLMDGYWDKHLKSSPMMASYFGDTTYSDRLDDLSEKGFAERTINLDLAIAELKKIPVKELSDANRVNYEVFEWMVHNERKTLDYDWRSITFNTVVGWQTIFAQIVGGMTTFNSEEDYRAYLKRLEAFGAFADQNMALMQKGIEVGYVQPCETLNGYEASISGFIAATPEQSLFYAPFNRIPASYGDEVISELQAKGKQLVSDVVNPAYQRYNTFFTETYKPACREIIGLSDIPKGRELYDHFVRYYTTMETDADAVHTLGLSEVKRIRAEMEAIMKEVDFDGDLKAFFAHLRTDPQFYPKSEEEFLAKAASLAKRIDGKLPEYFSYLPRNPYGIQPVPAHIAPKTAAGYYQGGAADGTRAGVYFLNTYNLKSRPLYTLAALTLHEGVPGHHQQISIAGELDSLPKFRRSYYFHAYGEGWGLYSEYLGEEMGIYDTPYDRFGRLSYEMWRALRLVVDSGMHAKGWSRQQAIDFMADNSALSLHNITSEVDRYITYPGQALAYKNGELKIRELRGKAEQVLGKHFSLREFHTLVLKSGAVPLTVLEGIVDRWIAEQKKA